MLKLHFLNVGDGDAILVRDDAANFVMLVDTGRPHIEFTKGSKRTSVINHLMRERIGHIDLLVLTHLHFDHIGGTLPVLRHIPVRRLLAVTLPPEGAPWIDSSISRKRPSSAFATRDLTAISLRRTRERHARETASPTAERLTPQLTMLPSAGGSADSPPTESVRRNLSRRAAFGGRALRGFQGAQHSSLRLRLTYAGRSILLTGILTPPTGETTPKNLRYPQVPPTATISP